MIEELLKNWQDSQMTVYFTKDTLEIIKSHTTIPSNIDIKIVPPKFVSGEECNEDMAFFIPNKEPLKVILKDKR